MRTIVICLALIINYYQGFAQESTLITIVDDITQAEDVHNKGVTFYTNKDYQNAILYFDSANQIRKGILPHIESLQEDDKSIFLTGYVKSIHNLGASYMYSEELGMAQKTTELSIAKQLQFHELYNFLLPLRLGRAYCQLGMIYQQTKGFDEAYSQLMLSKYYLNMLDPKPVRDISLVENILSNLFLMWEEADSILVHSKNQINLNNDNGIETSSATALNNAGVAKEIKNDLKEAISFYNQALSISRRDSLNNRDFIATIYRNRSYVFAKQKKWKEAIKSVDIGISINENLKESASVLIDRSELWMTKAYVYYLKKDFVQSIECYEKAMCMIIQGTSPEACNFSEMNILGNDDFLSLDNRILLLGLGYRAKGLALNKDYTKAKLAFNLAISFLQKIRREYNDTESKIKLTEIAKVIFEGAIALHLDPKVNDPAQAFAYAEQSKAFTLLEGVKHNKAMHIAEVPAELLDQEYDLRAQIAQLERQYLNAETPAEKTTALEGLRQQKEKLNEVMESLENNEGYRKLMSFEPPSISQIKRKALGRGQTLVEYFVGEEKTYVFVIPKRGKLEVLQLDVSSDSLNQMADAFWSSIYYYGCDEAVLSKEAKELAAMGIAERSALLKKRYLQYGQSLYHLLFDEVLKKHRGDHFVIVPDEGLSNMPFDALLMTPPSIDNYTYYDFLGKTVVLSYAHSANLLLEMQGQSTNQISRRILAIAPSFNSYLASTNKSTLNRLTNNKTEVDAICNIFSGECDPISGEGATREGFLNKLANPYWIIHLSTHGKANDKNPNQSWISFTQNSRQIDESQLLYASDLYGLSIDVELVVLSACETNKGRLRRGEGIMSFARGLSAAGVKSVLSTFWVIGEDPSLLVMKDFYQHLSAGDAKDVALQKARSALMDNSDFSHPFFWSAFVPIGKMVEVEAEASFPFTLLLLGIGLLGVLVVSRLRKDTV